MTIEEIKIAAHALATDFKGYKIGDHYTLHVEDPDEEGTVYVNILDGEELANYTFFYEQDIEEILGGNN